MNAKLLAVGAWGLHGAEPRLDGPELVPGYHPAPEPPRPDEIPVGSWRRMSRISRLAAAATAPVLAGVDRARIPLFWGTVYGEFSSTFGFLQSLFTKGPQGASPLAFQNAVHNAPAGHLSIGFGLRGPSETLCGGALTSLRTIERALAWVQIRQEPVLVVVGDELGPQIQRGLALANANAAFSEGAAALLLGPGEGISLGDSPVGTRWHRTQCWPFEPGFVAPGDGHDLRVGLSGAADALALVAAFRAGGAASVGWEGPGGPLWVRI